RAGRGDDRAREAEEDEEDPTPIQIPAWVAVVARVLFWLVVIAGAVALIVAIVLQILGWKGRQRAETTDAAEPIADEPNAPAAPTGPVETDVDRLLARARALAARGDHEGAVEAMW